MCSFALRSKRKQTQPRSLLYSQTHNFSARSDNPRNPTTLNVTKTQLFFGDVNVLLKKGGTKSNDRLGLSGHIR
jgi:hypothetical protein